MKVKALMNLLATFDQNAEVILQKDAEGNGYSPLEGADHDAVYVAQTTWYGDVYSTNQTADDHCLEEAEWKRLLKQRRCVVLFPVN
jgi:hypothetical protein